MNSMDQGGINESQKYTLPFTRMVLLDQKTPRELGFDDVPILSDIWGWTDPMDGTEYAIVASDARHVPFPISGEDQVASLYEPIGGVAFARMSPGGEINQGVIAGHQIATL